MKSLLRVFATIAFYAFVVVVLMWTGTLTLAEVRDILPDDPITPYFALALFDGGALVWLLVFIAKAKGLWQRGVSALMLLADLVGVIAFSMARLFSGGQTMTEVSPEMGAAVVIGLGVMTAINFLGIYAFHVTDPETLAEIEAQSLEDELFEEAQKQARANMEGEKARLAGVLAARATAGIKARLYLPISEGEALAMQGVIDGEIIENETDQDTTTPSKKGVPAWMVAASKILKGKPATQPAKVATQPEPTEAQKQAAREYAQAHMYIPGDGKSPKDATQPQPTDKKHYFRGEEITETEAREIAQMGATFRREGSIFRNDTEGGQFTDIAESQDGGQDGGYIPTEGSL